MNIVIDATAFAAQRHTSQRRKDENETPYIEHPIEVAQILSQVGVQDANCLAAALLHDTIEDTDTTVEELQREFGSNISNMVLEVTDDKSLAKDVRKRMQIVHASQVSNGAKMIKMADKLSNFRSSVRAPPKGWSEARIQGYFIWGLAVVEQCKITDGPFIEAHRKMMAMFDEFGKLVPKAGTPEAEEALEMYYASMKNASY